MMKRASNTHRFGSSKPQQVRITPRNDKQRAFVDMMDAEKPNIVIATGPAGCGKTLLAADMAVQKLMKKEIDRIVITRPTVSVDESLGFLPGSLEKKMEPWIRPITDALTLHMPKSKVDAMFKEQIVEVCPLAFMRGRTFSNSFVILDESQNTTVNQMLMVLTRIGEGSKLIVNGDPDQHDRGYTDNGLTDLMHRLDYVYDNQAYFGVVRFDEGDVQRHEAIPFIIDMYRTI